MTRSLEEKLVTNCLKAVRKAKNELNSDIFGFGEAIHRQHPKVWNKMEKMGCSMDLLSRFKCFERLV